jgi:hypothetical protein
LIAMMVGAGRRSVYKRQIRQPRFTFSTPLPRLIEQGRGNADEWNATMLTRVLKRFGALFVAGGVAIGLCAQLAQAQAQSWPPGPGTPPGPQAPGQPYQNQSSQNQACVRLEGQLAAIDRGGADPARAEQTRRYEEAANRQQGELNRMIEQSRRQGCESTGFFLFGGGNASSQQCVDLNRQIARMRGNLDRITVDLQRLQGGDSDRGEQKRSVLLALAQNNCGAQYRAAARQQGGFFDQLFGREGREGNEPGGELANPVAQGGSIRTVCVRTCDGYYFPISYATNASRFAQDEKACQRLCPAAEVQLFSYPTEGGDIAQATSTSGAPYSQLPNAFKYRQAFDAACSCKKPGQSWADALGKDEAIEAGDIVVTEDRAKQLSLPPAQKGQPKGRAPAGTPAQAATPPAEAPAAAAPPATETDGKKGIRSVGPPFIPAR